MITSLWILYILSNVYIAYNVVYTTNHEVNVFINSVLYAQYILQVVDYFNFMSFLPVCH